MVTVISYFKGLQDLYDVMFDREIIREYRVKSELDLIFSDGVWIELLSL